MVTFAYTVLVLGLASAVLYFAYKHEKAKIVAAWTAEKRHLTEAILNHAGELTSLDDRTTKLENVNRKELGIAPAPISLYTKSEERHLKKLAQVAEVNGQPIVPAA